MGDVINLPVKNGETYSLRCPCSEDSTLSPYILNDGTKEIIVSLYCNMCGNEVYVENGILKQEITE